MCPTSYLSSTNTTRNNYRGWRKKPPPSQPPSTPNTPKTYQPLSSTLPPHTNHHLNENHTPNTPPNHLTNHPSNTLEMIFGNGHHVNITPNTYRYTTRNTNHKPHHNHHQFQCDMHHHSPATGGETNEVFHHIPHVHERRNMGEEKPPAKTMIKNNYPQKIVNHANNNLSQAHRSKIRTTTQIHSDTRQHPSENNS